MKKKIIWIVVAIFVILIATLGILYFTTDLFQTPEQLFYKHLSKSYDVLGEKDYKNYEDFMKDLQKQKETSVEAMGEITAKISSKDEDVKQIADVLEKGKITYNIKTVGAEQKMQEDLTLNYNDKDIVTLNILQNKDQYGIKIEEAYDKYITVENNNLKALFEKLGEDATNIPDRIEMIDYYELLNMDNNTWNHIKTTYSDIIKQNIPEESYSIEKDVTVNYSEIYDDTQIKTNAYKLTLTQAQTKNVLIKVLETLKSDDVTLDLFIEKANIIMKQYKTMGIAQTEEIKKEDVVKAIEDELEELNKTEATDEKIFEVIAYGAKDGKAKIVMNVIDKNETVAKMEVNIKKDNSEEKQKRMKISMTVEDISMGLDIAQSDDKKQSALVLAMDTGDAKAEMLLNNKDNNATLDMKVESDGTTIQINVKQEIKDTQNVTVEDFTQENSVKLNDMTQTQIETLAQTIYTNVMKALPEKMELLGINNVGQLQTIM